MHALQNSACHAAVHKKTCPQTPAFLVMDMPVSTSVFTNRVQSVMLMLCYTQISPRAVL